MGYKVNLKVWDSLTEEEKKEIIEREEQKAKDNQPVSWSVTVTDVSTGEVLVDSGKMPVDKKSFIIPSKTPHGK
jgi:cytidylate kinase